MLSRPVAQLGPEDPVEQEQTAQKEQGARNERVSRPVKSSPARDEIDHAQRREEHAASPFPAPGKGEQQQEDGGRDEVHQERERGIPKPVMFVKDVEGEYADERGDEEAENSGCPEEEMFDWCFHIA
jgi:hypothetical protein